MGREELHWRVHEVLGASFYRDRQQVEGSAMVFNGRQQWAFMVPIMGRGRGGSAI
jgi:hypothetical protein